jgi:hypothetical protein
MDLAGNCLLIMTSKLAEHGVGLNAQRRWNTHLDREGLRIYASLRKRIPHLRASALYCKPAVKSSVFRGHG